MMIIVTTGKEKGRVGPYSFSLKYAVNLPSSFDPGLLWGANETNEWPNSIGST